MDNIKPINDKNQIWYAKKGDQVEIGFTPEFLQQMMECWHILPACKGLIREKDPLMAIETNDELVSIRSPIAGVVEMFNDKASNFPDKLTADDIIIVMNAARSAKIEKPERTGAPRARTFPQLDPEGMAPLRWQTQAFEAGEFITTNARVGTGRTTAEDTAFLDSVRVNTTAEVAQASSARVAFERINARLLAERGGVPPPPAPVPPTNRPRRPR